MIPSSRFGFLTVGFLAISLGTHAQPSQINLGFDYRLNNISTSNNDGLPSTNDNLSYSSHRIQGYIGGKTGDAMETNLRAQSINVWGLEGSTRAPASRYPHSDGTPWVEQAFVRLPRLMGGRLDLSLGRQPLTVGDGLLVADDDLGFNSLRARLILPWKMGLDLFTAKISEGLGGHNDFDLNGAVGSYRQEERLWELAWIQESHSSPLTYGLNGSTVAAASAERRFIHLRMFGDLKDAYYKLDFALEQGRAELSSGDSIKISGVAEKIELGAATDTSRFGRFGVKALYASGSGDDPASTQKDESFRPTFAHRWSGLQRAGWGRYFGATLSDAYNATEPFSSEGTGLPAGASGIKTLGFGIHTIQWVNWTGTLDYYTYDSRIKVSGQNSLGAELDLTIDYRYSSVLTFQGGIARFFPGDVYGPNTSQVARYDFQTTLHF